MAERCAPQAGSVPRLRQIRAAGPHPAQAARHQPQGAALLPDDVADDHHGGLFRLPRLQVPAAGRCVWGAGGLGGAGTALWGCSGATNGAGMQRCWAECDRNALVLGRAQCCKLECGAAAGLHRATDSTGMHWCWAEWHGNALVLHRATNGAGMHWCWAELNAAAMWGCSQAVQSYRQHRDALVLGRATNSTGMHWCCAGTGMAQKCISAAQSCAINCAAGLQWCCVEPSVSQGCIGAGQSSAVNCTAGMRWCPAGIQSSWKCIGAEQG